jgi:hypothetical protein
MGSLNNQMMDDQEHQRDVELAEIIGIGVGELQQYGFEIEEIENKDGVVLDVHIKFPNETPREFLDKIGVSPNENWISLGPNPFDGSGYEF